MDRKEPFIGHDFTQEQIIRCLNKIQQLKSQGNDVKGNETYRLLILVVGNYLKKDDSFRSKYQRNFEGRIGKTYHLHRLLHADSIDFTSSQKLRLKAQIYALKNHISENRPMPYSLIQAIRGLYLPQSLLEYENVFLPKLKSGYKVEETIPMTEDIEIQPPPLPTFGGSGMTEELKDSLFSSREEYFNRIIQTKKRVHVRTMQTSTTRPTNQLRAFVGLRQVDMISAQHQVRKKLLANSQPSLPFLRMSRNQPKIHLNQSETSSLTRTSRLEIDLKLSRNGIFKRKKEKKDRLRILNRAVLGYFDRLKKRGGLPNVRQQLRRRKRLEALRENDEQAYFQLLEKTKEKRILDLLRQTDNVLRKLGAQLLVKQVGVAEDVVVSFPTSEQEMMTYQEHLKTRESYYSLVHKFTDEIIPEQPKGLVGGVLRSYQLIGLQWLVSLYNNNINGILADEMGLGKTIQVIALFSYLFEKKANSGPHLIIAPLSTVPNWEHEFKKWCPSLKVVAYTGPLSKRREIERVTLKTKDFHVIVTQYDFARRDRAILKRIPWNYVVVDEGHRLKNKKTKLVTFLKLYKNEHRLLLTGTPVQNDLSELWSLLNFLLPKVFDSSDDFEKWFASSMSRKRKNQKKRRGRKKKSELEIELNEEEKLLVIHRLHQVLRPFLLRREIFEVENQLPQKSEFIVRVELSSLQKSYYDMIQRRNAIVVPNYESGLLEEQRLQNIMMQMRKVCNHPYLFYRKDMIEANENLIRSSGKFAVLDEMIPKLVLTKHKLLIFSQMTVLLDLLELFLKYRNFKFFRFDGAVKGSIREELIRKFNDPNNTEVNVFLLSTRSGGLGINLQVADTVILFDSDWNPQQDLQAQARVWRIGQTQEVKVFTLLTVSPVEYKMYERAQSKRKDELKIIKAGRYNTKSTINERQEILREVLKMNVHDFKGETVDKDGNIVDIGGGSGTYTTGKELNQWLSRNERELLTFNRMDEEREKRMITFFRDSGIYNEIPLRQNSRRAGFSNLIKHEELPIWLRDKSAMEFLLEMSRKHGLRRTRRKTGVIDYRNLNDKQFRTLLFESRKNKQKEEVSSQPIEEEEEEEEDFRITGRKRKRGVDGTSKAKSTIIILTGLNSKKKKKKKKKKRKKDRKKRKKDRKKRRKKKKSRGLKINLFPTKLKQKVDDNNNKSKFKIQKPPPLQIPTTTTILNPPPTPNQQIRKEKKGAKSILQSVNSPSSELMKIYNDNEDESSEEDSIYKRRKFEKKTLEKSIEEEEKSNEPPLKKLKRVLGDDGRRFSIRIPPLFHRFDGSVLGSRFQKDMYAIFCKIVNLVDKTDTKMNRSISQMFVELPEPKLYPDYFEKIKNPICLRDIEDKICGLERSVEEDGNSGNSNSLTNIRGRVNRCMYPSILALEEDIKLLVHNCHHYNRPNLQVYRDANVLWEEFQQEKGNYLENGRTHSFSTTGDMGIEKPDGEGEGRPVIGEPLVLRMSQGLGLPVKTTRVVSTSPTEDVVSSSQSMDDLGMVGIGIGPLGNDLMVDPFGTGLGVVGQDDDDDDDEDEDEEEVEGEDVDDDDDIVGVVGDGKDDDDDDLVAGDPPAAPPIDDFFYNDEDYNNVVGSPPTPPPLNDEFFLNEHNEGMFHDDGNEDESGVSLTGAIPPPPPLDGFDDWFL